MRLTTTTSATTTSTATTASPAAAAATATTVAGHLVETGINLLLGLLENLDEITSLLGVWMVVSNVQSATDRNIHTLCSEKGDGSSVSASTSSTTNTVDVILRVVRVIIVQHVSNVANILRANC